MSIGKQNLNSISMIMLWTMLRELKSLIEVLPSVFWRIRGLERVVAHLELGFAGEGLVHHRYGQAAASILILQRVQLLCGLILLVY